MIAWRDVLGLAAVRGDHKQVRAFEAGVVVPVAVEEARKDHGLDFGIGALFVFGFVAGVGAAIGIYLGDEQDSLPVREPHGAIGFCRDVGDLLGFSDCSARGRVKIGRPYLRAAATRADEEELLAVGRPAAAGFARWIGGQLP